MYDVLRRLKEAAHVWHNMGEMGGPFAVESLSEGCNRQHVAE